MKRWKEYVDELLHVKVDGFEEMELIEEEWMQKLLV